MKQAKTADKSRPEPVIDYQVHDIANIFPMMSSNEFESLKEDITANGLREPIYLYQNKIIDGRNRFKACIAAGIKPEFRNYEGTEDGLMDFVISLNLHRRHLSTSQKACLAVEIMPGLEKRTKENLSKKISAIKKNDKKALSELNSLNSSQTASKIFDVSERNIFSAKKLFKESEDLFNEVRNGNISLQQAFRNLDSAKLQKPKNTETSDQNTEPQQRQEIKLSKKDNIRIDELVKSGLKKDVATEIILKWKPKPNPAKVHQGKDQSLKSEVKFRFSIDIKNRLQLEAKHNNKSMNNLAEIAIKEYLEKLGI